MANMHSNNNNQPQKRRVPIFVFYIIFIVIVVTVSQFLVPMLTAPKHKEIKLNEFIEKIKNGEAVDVEFEKTKSRFILKPADFEESNTYYITGDLGNDILEYDIITACNEAGLDYSTPIPSNTAIWEILLLYVLPLVITVVFFIIMMRSMNKRMSGVMSFGKNTGKIYAQKSTGKTFADVAGQDEAKQSLVEIIDFLNSPGKYTAIGAKLPKGALLIGPPGTGKTLLAKAVAGEAGVPFFSLSGSEFVEMFVGVGASRVRDLFKQAIENAPCIIFIDEIDAIGKSRDNVMGGNDEREQTLNQLLAEMDGFDSSKGVVILAATNRPEVLDKALLRPGRFDRRIIVDLPDQQGRVDILKVHARNVIMEPDVDFDVVARATPGASGADLANIVNEAALRAVRAKKTRVSQTELDDAIEVIIAGEEKKNKVMSDHEKRIVSYHETGHALVTALLTHTEPVHKITIIPRTSGTLGYVMQVAKKEKVLLNTEEMMEEITILTAGRASEKLEFNSITTGASNDIEKATELARKMITVYGMSDDFGFVNREKTNNKYLIERSSLDCPEDTANRIDSEMQRVITECYNKAFQLLSDHKATLDRIAGVLYDKENLTGSDFMELMAECEPDIEIKKVDDGI